MSGKPTNREMQIASDWSGSAFEGAPSALPISFRYDGADSASLLDAWAVEHGEPVTSDGTTVRSVTYRDPATNLVCSFDITNFDNFPAIEWLPRFTNEGDSDTPIISDVLALDTLFPFDEEPIRIHSANGSLCAMDDFAPTVSTLQFPKQLRMGSEGGRSSSGAFPFFNAEWDNHGVIGSIGWTGNWDAVFELVEDRCLHMTAGMRELNLRLHPGESIRMPRILLVFWENDRLHGHNVLRQLIVKHHSPQLCEDSPVNQPVPSTQQALPARQALPVPPLSWAVWGENEDERQLAKVRWMTENDIEIDNFWIDAGWHGDTVKTEKPTVFNTAWGDHVGNWWPNKANYPDGLGSIGKLAGENGMRFTLWFDTERVYKDTQFVREHPEWLLGPDGDYYMIDLGNPEACAAITDIISSVISENNVTLYRQDFNMDPERYWRDADPSDRRGMNEIRHIEGLYAFWDELLRRHPGLIIDNCASGGRRIDLETISRSIPLWRSDYQCFRGFDLIGMQSQTHGLSLWVPFSAGACDRAEDAAFRSAILPGIVITTDVAGPDEPEGYRTPWDAYPVEWLRRMTHEQRAVKDYASGDFYPLLEFSLARDAWCAWQFDRPDLGEGCVIVLRRPDSPFASMELRLRGIDPDERYDVYSFDDSTSMVWSGRDLVDGNMSVAIDTNTDSRLYKYQRV
jgi:alpha-galactosidase